jgi:hypothetical protein
MHYVKMLANAVGGRVRTARDERSTRAVVATVRK